jgi:hypothetical protein
MTLRPAVTTHTRLLQYRAASQQRTHCQWEGGCKGVNSTTHTAHSVELSARTPRHSWPLSQKAACYIRTLPDCKAGSQGQPCTATATQPCCLHSLCVKRYAVAEGRGDVPAARGGAMSHAWLLRCQCSDCASMWVRCVHKTQTQKHTRTCAARANLGRKNCLTGAAHNSTHTGAAVAAPHTALPDAANTHTLSRSAGFTPACTACPQAMQPG